MINDEDLSNNINYRESLYHNHDFLKLFMFIKDIAKQLLITQKK